MSTYAIVESGGKQYRVEEGQSLLVDRISEDEGAKVGLRAVMFRSDSDTVIAPKDLEKVKVEAKIAAHERGEKIKVFKYKAKKGYRKHQGHRSELTRLEVTEVKLLSRKPAAAKSDERQVGRRREAGGGEGTGGEGRREEAGCEEARGGEEARREEACRQEAGGQEARCQEARRRRSPPRRSPPRRSRRRRRRLTDGA